MSDTSAQRGPTYSPKSSPFLNAARKVMCLEHMSRQTEASYLHDIVRFIRFWASDILFNISLAAGRRPACRSSGCRRSRCA
jgi:hypothetical protein